MNLKIDKKFGCGRVAMLFVMAGSMVFAGCAAKVASPTSAATNNLKPLTGGSETLTFNAETQVLAQSGGTAYFYVERTGTPTGAVGVSYMTDDGTAIPGTDYTSESGNLSWADGDAAVKTIAVPILVRSPKSKVTFHIDLSSPTGDATLGTVPTAVVSLEDSFTAPSTLTGFSFSNWKLTLPVNEYRTTDNTYEAWTIAPSDLTNSFADAYFYASGSDVVFVAPATGATTTPGSGSDHTRSELRELYTGSGHDSNDDWTDSIGGTLTGSCVVNSVASSAGEATIAQIHGQDNAFALLVYRPESGSLGNVELDTYDANSSTSTKTYTTILTNVSLSTVLSYTLTYNSSNQVSATVNGTNKAITAGTTWSGAAVYFKAGAYHDASDTGAGTTQVTYSAVSASH